MQALQALQSALGNARPSTARHIASTSADMPKTTEQTSLQSNTMVSPMLPSGTAAGHCRLMCPMHQPILLAHLRLPPAKVSERADLTRPDLVAGRCQLLTGPPLLISHPNCRPLHVQCTISCRVTPLLMSVTHHQSCRWARSPTGCSWSAPSRLSRPAGQASRCTNTVLAPRLKAEAW